MGDHGVVFLSGSKWLGPAEKAKAARPRGTSSSSWASALRPIVALRGERRRWVRPRSAEATISPWCGRNRAGSARQNHHRRTGSTRTHRILAATQTRAQHRPRRTPRAHRRSLRSLSRSGGPALWSSHGGRPRPSRSRFRTPHRAARKPWLARQEEPERALRTPWIARPGKPAPWASFSRRIAAAWRISFKRCGGRSLLAKIEACALRSTTFTSTTPSPFVWNPWHAWLALLRAIFKAVHQARRHALRALRERLAHRARAAASVRYRASTSRAVAELCGFHTPQYFCRVFRQSVGVTPLEYRKKPRKMPRSGRNKNTTINSLKYQKGTQAPR